MLPIGDLSSSSYEPKASEAICCAAKIRSISPMVATVIETTDDVKPNERWTFWKDTAMAAVDGTRLDVALPFSAHRAVTSLTSGILADTTSEPVFCRRPTHKIAQDGDDGVCLMILRKGDGIIDQQDFSESKLPAGDLKLFDLARQYTVAVPASYRETRLYVPRSVFAEKVGSIDGLVGLQIPAELPLAGLFNQYLSSFLISLPTMMQVEADAGLDGTLHLLSGLVASRTDVRRRDEEQVSGDALVCMANHYIADLLGHPKLDVATLARIIGVSRATLYRAFSGRGGIATAIRAARLDRAKYLVSALSHQHRTLEAVAHECGFSDYPTFARAFRKRFGAPPSDVRGR
jgi:AraC family transcriptional activator of tynA and feaB